MTNPQPIKLPAHQRLNTFRLDHLKKMITKLQAIDARPDVASDTWSFDQFTYLMGYCWTSQQIDQAHSEVVADYRRYGYPIKAVQGRGRPIGSKNKRPQIDIEADILSTDDKPAEHPLTDKPLMDASELAKVITEILEQAITPWDHKNDQSRAYIENDLRAVKRLQNTEQQRTDETIKAISNLSQRVDQIKDFQPTIVHLKNNELPIIDLGLQHKNFPELLNMCAARQRSGYALNIWLVGPAGTGKSTAAENVAKSLSLPFYTTGALSAPHEVLGFNNAHTYVPTEFRKAWENGGIYCLDEADASTPQAMLALNGALAGSICAFADKNVRRHKDCIIIATANTVGYGASAEYSGRFKQDAAALDRFVQLDWPIDEGLEGAMCANKEWVDYVRKIRANVAKHGQKIMITLRATLYGEALLAQGISWDRVVKATLQKGLTEAQWKIINQ